MIEEKLLRICLRLIQRIEKKLLDIDNKLDHIIFRLREEDPRIESAVEGRKRRS